MRELLLKSTIMAMAIGLVPAIAGADSTDRLADKPAAVGSDEKNSETTLVGALRGGTTSVRFRYRYEFVTDEAFRLDAHASTVRTTLGYETLQYHGLSLGVEVENVRPIGNDLYDNRGAGHRHNERFGRPAVADPRFSGIYCKLLTRHALLFRTGLGSTFRPTTGPRRFCSGAFP